MREPHADQEYPETLFPLKAVTRTIIASAFTVFNKFGFGFLESVYRRALVVELRYRGVRVDEESRFEMTHRGESIGKYKADIIADSRVIVDAKTGRAEDPGAPKQLLNYLSIARLNLGLVIHFGPRGVQVRRVIASKEREPDD